MFIVAKQFDGSGWPGIRLVYYITQNKMMPCVDKVYCATKMYTGTLFMQYTTSLLTADCN